MKISVKVRANSSQEKVVMIDEKNYDVWIKEKPVEGRANESITEILKKYFKREVKIVSGFTSRKKIIEI